MKRIIITIYDDIPEAQALRMVADAAATGAECGFRDFPALTKFGNGSRAVFLRQPRKGQVSKSVMVMRLLVKKDE